MGWLPGNPNGIGSGIGSVDNQTTNSYPAMASPGRHGTPEATIVTPGHNGGGTNRLNDIDFVFPTRDRPLNTKTNGAFKIQSNESRIRPDPVPGMTNNAKISNFWKYWPPASSSNLTGYPKQ